MKYLILFLFIAISGPTLLNSQDLYYGFTADMVKRDLSGKTFKYEPLEISWTMQPYEPSNVLIRSVEYNKSKKSYNVNVYFQSWDIETSPTYHYVEMDIDLSYNAEKRLFNAVISDGFQTKLTKQELGIINRINVFWHNFRTASKDNNQVALQNMFVFPNEQYKGTMLFAKKYKEDFHSFYREMYATSYFSLEPLMKQIRIALRSEIFEEGDLYLTMVLETDKFLGCYAKSGIQIINNEIKFNNLKLDCANNRKAKKTKQGQKLLSDYDENGNEIKRDPVRSSWR